MKRAGIVGLLSLLLVATDAAAIPPPGATPKPPPKTEVGPINPVTGPPKCVGGPATAPTMKPTLYQYTNRPGRPGQTATISGTGFSGPVSVSFIQSMPFGPGQTFSWFDVQCTIAADGTSLSIVLPASMSADSELLGWRSFKMRITNSLGSLELESAVMTMRAPLPPTFSKPSGHPGDVIDIIGGPYMGSATVKFNGVVATKYVYPSPPSVIGGVANAPPNYNPQKMYAVKVPAGATTGPVTVETLGGTATSAASFIVPLQLAHPINPGHAQ